MVSSTAIKGPCKSSRGWSPGTLPVVCPVVLSSFFFLPLPVIFLVPMSPLHMSVPPSQLTCSCFHLWCGGGYLHFATEFTLSAWPSFGNCCPWALFEISGEGKTQQQLTSDQSALLPLPPYWGRKGISPNRSHPAPSTCPGKYYPNTFSVMIPEQQSIFNSSSLKLFSGLWGEFLKKQFVGNVLEN